MLLIRPGAIPRRYGTLSATTLLNDLLMPEQLAPELLHPKCAQDRGGGFDEAVQGSRSLFPPCCTHRLCDRCPGPECSSPSSVCGRANERRRYKRRKIAVVFNKPMAPASINAGSFKVAGVSGAVSYDSTNRIGQFKPDSDYAPNHTYHATVTADARDIGGRHLAAPFDFTFVTRGDQDSSPPTIISTDPTMDAVCVPLDVVVKITFDEQMDSSTINQNTFFNVVPALGTVTYDSAAQTATLSFVDHGGLGGNTVYTITATTGMQDLGGVPLAENFYLHFKTGPCS